MNRDVRGVRGQFVTTWGRDLEGDVWTGPEHPVTTVVTCVCGKTTSYRGFPDDHANRRAGFKQPFATDEWFCTLECAVQHEPDEARKLIAALRAEAVNKIAFATKLQGLLPP